MGVGVIVVVGVIAAAGSEEPQAANRSKPTKNAGPKNTPYLGIHLRRFTVVSNAVFMVLFPPASVDTVMIVKREKGGKGQKAFALTFILPFP